MGTTTTVDRESQALIAFLNHAKTYTWSQYCALLHLKTYSAVGKDMQVGIIGLKCNSSGLNFCLRDCAPRQKKYTAAAGECCEGRYHPSERDPPRGERGGRGELRGLAWLCVSEHHDS